MQLMFSVLSHPGRPREPFCAPWKAPKADLAVSERPASAKVQIQRPEPSWKASSAILPSLEDLESRSCGFGNASQRKSANSTLEGLESRSGSFGNGSQCKSANSTLEGLESLSGSFGDGSQCKSANSQLRRRQPVQKCKFTLAKVQIHTFRPSTFEKWPI